MANNPLATLVRLPDDDEADGSLTDSVLAGKVALGWLAIGDVAGADLGNLGVAEFVRGAGDHQAATLDHLVHVLFVGSLMDVPPRLGVQGVAAERVIASVQADGLRPPAVNEAERDKVGGLRASAIEAEFSGAHPEDPAASADGLSPRPAFIVATAVNAGPETRLKGQVGNACPHTPNNTPSIVRELG